MRCEPWMNQTPVPTKTPRQLAQEDMRYWKDELDKATARLDECQTHFKDAINRVAASHS